jgi:hypothetical protein
METAYNKKIVFTLVFTTVEVILAGSATTQPRVAELLGLTISWLTAR